MLIAETIAGQVLDDVYVIEVPSPPQIQGVPVGVVGMVGTFSRGIPDAIYQISDYPTAVRLLGKSSADVGGPISIQNLLRQGCGDIRVVAAFGEDAAAATLDLMDEQNTPGVFGTLTASQRHPQSGDLVPLYGDSPNTWTAIVTQPTTPNDTFTLTINGSSTEVYRNLTAATWIDAVNAVSAIAMASEGDSGWEDQMPEETTGQFAGGSVGDLTAGSPLDSAIIGSVSEDDVSTGLELLKTLAKNEINIVFVAGDHSDVVNASLAEFANLQNCIAAMCSEEGDTLDEIIASRALISQDNVAYIDGWTTAFDSDLGENRTCAPDALVVGMASQLPPQFSWGNKSIFGTQGLVTPRNDANMSTAQLNGILCLANKIPRGGFGTRSGIATDGSDLYVRRMRYFLEFSIATSMGWAVDALQSTSAKDPLRRDVTQSLSTFLSVLANPVDPTLKVIDAFSVVCNKTNNPDEQVAAGLLNVSVTVRLLAAAKKIIISANISTSAVTTSSGVA